MFNYNSNYPVGLDISDTSLKVTQLNKIVDRIKIQALGRVNLNEGVLRQGEVINKNELLKVIKNLLENPQFGKITSNEVVACLPENKTFIKYIDIEKGPNNLENVIEFEIEKHVPMSLNDIYYDWQLIDTSQNHYHVLIGAAAKNIVDQYAKILSEAGLSVVALEIEPVAVCRSLLSEENGKYKGPFDKNYIIIDIGAIKTSLTFYAKNAILFTMGVPISGTEITKQISDILKIELNQAEKAKLICGFDESKAKGVVRNILSDVIEDLIKKINNAIEFYSTHFPEHGPITEIILCGGGANIKNLGSVINVATQIPTSVGNAARHVINSDFKKIVNQVTKNKLKKINGDSGTTYATAIGLGLRNLFVNNDD